MIKLVGHIGFLILHKRINAMSVRAICKYKEQTRTYEFEMLSFSYVGWTILLRFDYRNEMFTFPIF